MTDQTSKLLKIFARLTGLHVTNDLQQERMLIEEMLKYGDFCELRHEILDFVDEHEGLLNQRRGSAEDSVIWGFCFSAWRLRTQASLLSEAARNQRPTMNQQTARRFLLN